jgi:hypothetical protein
MSQIDPVHRNPFPNVATHTGLNGPAPAPGDDEVSAVEPVQSINPAELLAERREIRPEVDIESDRLIMQVVDKDTKEVVFQAPPEITLRMAREIRQQQKRRGSGRP